MGVTTALAHIDLSGVNAKVSKRFFEALAAVLQQVTCEWVVGSEDGIEFAVLHFELNLNAAQVGGRSANFIFHSPSLSCLCMRAAISVAILSLSWS